MPIARGQNNFMPIRSTAPSFEVTFGAVSTANALESTGIREWSGPSGRAVRFATKTAADFYVNIGTSDIVAASTDSMSLLGGTVETIKPPFPNAGFIALYSSTDVTVNITLGYGQ